MRVGPLEKSLVGLTDDQRAAWLQTAPDDKGGEGGGAGGGGEAGKGRGCMQWKAHFAHPCSAARAQ